MKGEPLPNFDDPEKLHRYYEDRLVYQINRERVSPDRADLLCWGSEGRIGKGNSSRPFWIEKISKEDPHQNDAKPGQEGEVVDRVEVAGNETEPEEPGRVEGELTNQKADGYRH